MPRPHASPRAFALAAFIIATTAVVRAQDAAPRPSPSPTPAAVVTLSVLVTDDKGRYMDDVGREEFCVIEGGAEQKTAFVEKDASPLSYGLVVDNSGSSRSIIDILVGTAKGFVSKNREGDETFVARFVGSDRIQVTQDFTTNRAALERALDQMYVEGGQTALIDAVYLTAEHVAKRGRADGGRRRRALILLTDGEDRASHHRLDDLLKLLRETDVEIYPIGFVRLLDDVAGFIRPSKRDQAVALLKRLAEETGGRAYFPKKMPELQDAFNQITRHLGGRYLVGYTPSAERAGKPFRKVEVKIADAPGRAKRVAVTRPGYTAAVAKKE